MEQNKIGRSSFFGLGENKAAALTAVLPLVISFVPHAGYFGWIVPIIAAVFEIKSKFARLCAVQSAFAAVIMTASAAVFERLSSTVTDSSDVPFGVSLCGMLLSLLRVAALIVLIYIAANGFSMRKTNVPVITVLAEKISKYNGH